MVNKRITRSSFSLVDWLPQRCGRSSLFCISVLFVSVFWPFLKNCDNLKVRPTITRFYKHMKDKSNSDPWQ